MGYEVMTPIEMKEDNTGTIAIAKNSIVKSRVKHLDIKVHAIRERIQDGSVNVEYIATEDQTADLFTKALPEVTFLHHRYHLGMEMWETVDTPESNLRETEDEYIEDSGASISNTSNASKGPSKHVRWASD
jgi:hypothetical protein